MSQAEAAQAAGVSLTHRRVSLFVLLLRISVCVFKCYLLQWGVLWRGEMGGQAALCPGVLRSTWAVVLPLTVPEPPHTPAAVCTQQVSKHCMGGARRFPSSHLLPRPACCVIFIPCRQQRDLSPRPWSAQRRDRRPLHLVGCPQGGASSPALRAGLLPRCPCGLQDETRPQPPCRYRVRKREQHAGFFCIVWIPPSPCPGLPGQPQEGVTVVCSWCG